MGMWQEILIPMGIMVSIYTAGTVALKAYGKAAHGTVSYQSSKFDTNRLKLNKITMEVFIDKFRQIERSLLLAKKIADFCYLS